MQISFLLILFSYTKFERNSLRNNEITDYRYCSNMTSEVTSYLNNGYGVMNCFAKFEKFLPHSIIIPSFMAIVSQMPELDLGAFLPPPLYKIGS